MPGLRFDATLVTRRDLLKGSAAMTLGLASMLSGCGINLGPKPSAKRNLKPVLVQLNWIRNVEFAGILWAAGKGYYEQEGLQVSVLPAGTTTSPITLVASGAAQVGCIGNGGYLLLARNQGIPVKAFGADMQTAPQCWITLKSSHITTMQDLRGKVIGIQEFARSQLAGVLAGAGLTVQDVTIKAVGTDPSVLVTHEVDAFGAYATNQPIALAEQGIPVNVILWADYGYRFYADCLFATDSTLTGDKSLIEAFTRATRRGWQEVIAHRSEAAQYVVSQYGNGNLKLQQQNAELTAQIPLMQSKTTASHGLLAMTAAQWRVGIDFYTKYGLIHPGLSPSDVAVDLV